MAESRSSGATSGKSRRRDESGAYGRGEDPQGRHTGDRSDKRRRKDQSRSESAYNYDIGQVLDDVRPQAVPAIVGASAGLLLGLFLGGRQLWMRSGTDAGWQRDRREGRAERSPELETDETTELIASSKVEGTAVYGRDGEKLGHIHNFMVGKRSGRVAYAVLNFGGILGVGGSFYPLPWNQLDYDTERGGYVVDLDKDRINEAPSFRASEEPFSDPSFGVRVSDYWAQAS